MGGIGKPFVMTAGLQKAVDRGRYIHRVMELFLNNGDFSPEVFSYIAEKENDDLFAEHYEYLMFFFGAYSNFPEHWELVATEQIFYDKENNIAGSIDAVFYNPANWEIIIVDWKTGKEKMPDYAQVAIYTYAVKKILEKEFPHLKYRKELVYYEKKNYIYKGHLHQQY